MRMLIIALMLFTSWELLLRSSEYIVYIIREFDIQWSLLSAIAVQYTAI